MDMLDVVRRLREEAVVTPGDFFKATGRMEP